jgi:hypothetical protein
MPIYIAFRLLLEGDGGPISDAIAAENKAGARLM